VSVITLSLILNFCNDNPLTDEDKPGSRDYVWTIDTIKVSEGYASPFMMWGSTASNVWALAHSYLNAYRLWHYDGLGWTNNSVNEYIDPWGIFGFSCNNIWAASLSTSSLPASFWHYNGTSWLKFCEINIEGYYHITIQSISGNAANNIYAVGFADSIDGQSYKGIIFHFNGATWTQVNIPNIRNSFVQIFYDSASNNFLIAGNTFETINQYVYNFDGNEISEIYSTQEGVLLCLIGKSIYLQSNGKLLKYANQEFGLFKDFSPTNYIGNAWGRNEMDFFTINWDGIGHFNGTDLITIYKKSNDNWFPSGAVIFDKDVFFIWGDSYNDFIVHGRLMD
jgi:hypothetical protein